VTSRGSYVFDGYCVWSSFSLLRFKTWVGDGSGDPIEPSLKEEGSLYSTMRLARPERLGARAGSMLAMQ
jgi:hypothetical protein